MANILKARVKSIDPRQDRIIGKAILNDLREEVIFNGADFRRFCIKNNSVEFSDKNDPKIQIKPGDTIVIEAPANPYESLRYCGRWGLESDHKKVQEELFSKTKPLYNAILRERIVGANEWGEPYFVVKNAPREDLGEIAYAQHGSCYNPINPFRVGQIEKFIEWQVSFDEGKTWKACDCPDEYKNENLEG